MQKQEICQILDISTILARKFKLFGNMAEKFATLNLKFPMGISIFKLYISRILRAKIQNI